MHPEKTVKPEDTTKPEDTAPEALPPYLHRALKEARKIHDEGGLITSRALMEALAASGDGCSQAHVATSLALLGAKGYLLAVGALNHPTGKASMRVWEPTDKEVPEPEEAKTDLDQVLRTLARRLAQQGPKTMRQATVELELAHARLSNAASRPAGLARFEAAGVKLLAQADNKGRAVVLYVEGQQERAEQVAAEFLAARGEQAQKARINASRAAQPEGKLAKALHELAAMMEGLHPSSTAALALRQRINEATARDRLAQLERQGLVRVAGHHHHRHGQRAPLWVRTDKPLPPAHDTWTQAPELLRAALRQHGPLTIRQAEAAAGAPKNLLWPRLRGAAGFFLAREAFGQVRVGPLEQLRDEEGKQRGGEQRSGYRVLCLEDQQDAAVEVVRQMRVRVSIQGAQAQAQAAQAQAAAQAQPEAQPEAQPQAKPKPTPEPYGIQGFHAKQRRTSAAVCARILAGGPKPFLELIAALKQAEDRIHPVTLRTHLREGHPDFAAIGYLAHSTAPAVVFLKGSQDDEAQRLHAQLVAAHTHEFTPKPPKPPAQPKTKAEPQPKPQPKPERAPSSPKPRSPSPDRQPRPQPPRSPDAPKQPPAPVKPLLTEDMGKVERIEIIRAYIARRLPHLRRTGEIEDLYLREGQLRHRAHDERTR